MVKNVDKYAQTKRLHHDLWLLVNMYVFVYVDPEIIPAKEYFPATKKFADDYNKIWL